MQPAEQQQLQASAERMAHYERDIPIEGRFGRHQSSYWSGLLAAFGLRYASRPWLRPNFDQAPTYGAKHKYSAVAGGIMEAVTGYYGMKTWHDIRSILGEAVAWEKNKDEKDVTFFDFWNSENTIVKQTMSNFVKYNVRRAVVNSAFFLPFIPGVKKYFEKHNFTGEAGVDFGMAANSAYLLYDVIDRRMTPFEELQSLIDRKINHTEHYADRLTANDLLDIYERHAAGDPSRSFMPLRGTGRWNDVIELFERMADLMNQTYHNQIPTENVEFGFSRYVYLIGHQMLDPNLIERSQAYVEIVAQYGVEALKEANQRFRRGEQTEDVLASYPKAAETFRRFSQPGENCYAKDQSQPVQEAAAHTPARQKIIEQKQPLASYSEREQAHKAQAAEKPGQLAI